MVVLDSTRQLHTELAIVCASFEALFLMNDDDRFVAAASPALTRFRELLDVGDALVTGDELPACSGCVLGKSCRQRGEEALHA